MSPKPNRSDETGEPVNPGEVPFDGMIEGGQTNGEQFEEEMGVNPEPQQETTALGLYSSTPSFEAGDVILPRLRLAQGLSQDVQDGTAKPGQWLLSGFEPANELTIVPLLFTRRRELRDDEFNVLCQSNDAITGVGEPGGQCASCPFNKWSEDPRTKKRMPPACTFFYSYIVFVCEHHQPAIMDFKRTSLQAGKMVNTVVSRYGLGQCGLQIKSSPQQGKKGTYFAPVLIPVRLDKGILEEANQAI